MIASLCLIFPPAVTIVVHARTDERVGFEVSKLRASSLGLQPLGAQVFIPTDSPIKLFSLRFSPTGRFFFIIGDRIKDRKTQLWIFDARMLEQTDRHVFTRYFGWPYWISSTQLAVKNVVESKWTPVFTISPLGKLSHENRMSVPSSSASNGAEGEKIMAKLNYLWPESHNSRPDFGALQFDNRQGQAVIASDGTTILTCVEDLKSPTKSKSILLERKNGSWIEHRLGNHAWATFTLFGEVFSLYDSPSRRVALYDKKTRRQLGMVQCDVHDLGPLLK